MFHASEGSSSVIHHTAPHGGLHSIEDAQAVVECQRDHQALLWQVPDVGNASIMHAAA